MLAFWPSEDWADEIFQFSVSGLRRGKRSTVALSGIYGKAHVHSCSLCGATVTSVAN